MAWGYWEYRFPKECNILSIMKKSGLLTLFAAFGCLSFAQDAPAGAPSDGKEQSPGSTASASLTPGTTYTGAAPEHGLTLAVSTSSPEAQQAVLRGLSHLITFWDEAAYLEFKYALFLDPECAMAHWGLVLSTITPNDERTGEKEASLKKLQEYLNAESLPEKELAYIRALYVLLRDGPRTAAEQFEAISQQWKSDEAAPLFAAMLCRNGFDDNGKPRDGQLKAIRILDSLIVKNESLQPAHFLRALLEETNPVVTVDTLSSAYKAVELSPHHAPSLHLLGHLSFRAGEYEQAERHFNQAAEQYTAWQQGSHLTLADNEHYFRSILYRAVSEFCRGDQAKAKKTASDLAVLPVNLKRPKAKGTLIQLWEVRHLPLKMALSVNPPTPKAEIEKLIPPVLDAKAHLLSSSVTAASLQYGSLLLAQADRNTDAIDVHLGNLDRLSGLLRNSYEISAKETSTSYWLRLMELTEQYMIAAKAMLYPSSADVWYAEASQKQKPSSLLLPPVLLYPVEWRQALTLLDQNKYEECAKACDAGLAKYPNHASVLATRKQALEKLQQPDSLAIGPRYQLPYKTPADSEGKNEQDTKEFKEAHPFLDDTFFVPWSKLTPERVKPDIELAIKTASENIDTICELDITTPDQLTYDNTFGALENAPKLLNTGWSRLMHLNAVMDNPKQRDAITEMMPEVVKYQTSVALNTKLWHVLKAASQCPWAKEVSPTKQRFIEETLANFKDSGADLPEDKKQVYAEIETELSMLTMWYGKNVLDCTNKWELIVTDKNELKGLPESAVETARLDALAKGHGTEEEPAWRFTLHTTSLGPVMKFAESAKLRRKMWEGSAGIGYHEKDNAPLIDSILKLRDQKAALLGYANFADCVTSRRMVGNGKTALDFIDNLHSLVMPQYKQEMADLLSYKNSRTGEKAELLDPWDIDYWSEKRRQELFNFDGDALRPYFSVNNVMKGMFDIFSTLYDIEIKQKPTVYLENGRKKTRRERNAIEVWHPEVKFYEIYDNKTKQHLGSFYTDWHPRESKRSGAWMNYLSIGLPPQQENQRIPHLGLMCGNMTKPVGSKPALVSHQEVKTIFHEFGHLLHLMLCDVEVKSLAGTRVAWDFVELPSQINENWIWQRESIDMYAKHYQSGKKISQEMFNKLIESRKYMSASVMMRQLAIAKIDLELHINYEKFKDKNIDEIDQVVLENYRVPMSVTPPSYARRLTHVFSSPTGYAAGYYSYKWAEVLEADAFSRFLKEGILNPETGQDFRRCILSKGNSKPASELFRDFMGRDPNSDALLIKYGIKKPEPSADHNRMTLLLTLLNAE